ncbi:MAG: PAS domain-containing protein [Rhodospirillales bacterium]|nr:PAS domain-containing protein [Rhodospirillales bacterium]
MAVVASTSHLEPCVLLEALRSFRKGDFSVRLPTDLAGIDGEIAEAFNDIIERHAALTREVARLCVAIGKERRIGERGTAGKRGETIDCADTPIADLAQPTTEVARAIDAVAKGDPSQTMQLEARLLLEIFRIRLEKARADEALQWKEEQEALIIKSLPLALWMDPLSGGRVGRRRYVSGDLERLTGYPAARFASDGGLWHDGIGEADRARVLAELEAVLESGNGTVEYVWRRADGVARYFLDQAKAVDWKDGQHREIIGTTLDITERKQLELQLAQAQKLEALGKLTGGIAHDFNNMLSIVIGNLDLVAKSISEPVASRRAKSALEGALRCAEMTQRLLTFARRRPFETKQIDLSAFVPSVMELLRRTMDEKIAIEVFIEEGLWPIRSDPAQIEAAVVNLALNARDAMPDGGRLTIRLENRTVRQGALEPGDYVALTISDTGIGMSEEVLKHAFEPFFTTKAVGKGTGLGLSTTYGSVKASRGHIEIESARGKGTSVRVLLPRWVGKEDSRGKRASAASRQHGA